MSWSRSVWPFPLPVGYCTSSLGGENLFRRAALSPPISWIFMRWAACVPCVVTQCNNCGSRLLQPLVIVTKIGTKVSCHSKSSFFAPYQSGNLGSRRLHSKGASPEGEKRKAARVYSPGLGQKYHGGFSAAMFLYWRRTRAERARPSFLSLSFFSSFFLFL